jgi:hypothetical protein
MNNNVIKVIALILLVVLVGSCRRNYFRRYKTKWRYHRSHIHYRGGGRTF